MKLHNIFNLIKFYYCSSMFASICWNSLLSTIQKGHYLSWHLGQSYRTLLHLYHLCLLSVHSTVDFSHISRFRSFRVWWHGMLRKVEWKRARQRRRNRSFFCLRIFESWIQNQKPFVPSGENRKCSHGWICRDGRDSKKKTNKRIDVETEREKSANAFRCRAEGIIWKGRWVVVVMVNGPSVITRMDIICSRPR